MQSFGKRLAAARNAQGLTQEDLARVLDVARNTISSWERDRTLPDVETLRRISDVLKCDLMAPETADIPQAGSPVAPDAVEPAGEPRPEDVGTPLPVSRRKKLAWIIAAAAVLCACLVAGWLHFRKPAPDPASDPNLFSVEYYQQQTPNEPGQAWFTFDNQVWEASGENMSFQHYLIKMDEQNGVAYDVTRLEVRVQANNGVVRASNMSASDLQAAKTETAVPPYGSFSVEGGFPIGQFDRIGVAVFGTDANGTPLAFYSLIEL